MIGNFKRPLELLLGGLFFLFYFSQSYAGSQVVDVEIFKFKYSPEVVIVNVGDTVRWINKEKRQYHSVQFNQDGFSDKPVKSEYLFPGEAWEYTFTKQGDYSYLCGPHPEMLGKVNVVVAP